ncbi:MAG: TetR/AcrR family transcriptional regulator [Candidatus Xenobiia bacterium LiM19]
MSLRSNRKKEIVETARKIISSSGMQSLTINAIAKELKLTDGALYRHFRSKHEILEMLIEDIKETLFHTVESAAEGIDDPIKKLESIFSSHLSYLEQRRGVSFLVITETLNLQDKKLQRMMMEVLNDYLKMIESIIEKGITSGVFGRDIDLHSASTAFLGIIQSAVTLWALSGYRHSLGRKHHSLFNVFKSGVEKRNNLR